MLARFDPLSALEGFFLGFPFKIARERGEGGRRGPLHEYPDRDEPYFEDLGRRARRWELNVYFVGPTADLQADLWDKLLWKGTTGPLILPRLRRERVKAQTWSYDRDAGKGNWVSCQVTFVEAGQNQFPAPSTSWPHALLEAALDARTAFADALGGALELIGLDGTLSQEALESLVGDALALGEVLTVVAQVAGGLAPSSALASAGLLVAAYTGGLSVATLDTVVLATSTVTLLAGWSDALAGPSPERSARSRAIDGLFGVYDQAASDDWYAPGALSPLQAIQVANQAAFSQGIRRAALAEVARHAASLDFASYDDAAALRERLADAFDDEINFSTVPDGARARLLDLRSATLQAISAAGADKAKLVPYAVPRPRPALALAQLFYGDDSDVPARAAELVARTGAIHPAFLPARGERLSK
jgi:prophage DNA circulation protein